MIRLRVVGTTDDHGQLILSNKSRGKRGSHVVEIDQKMLSVLQDAVYARRAAARAERTAEASAPEPLSPRSKLPPREIQRLLRAGNTVAQVAKASDVDVSYVEQFLVPVLYEREGIVREAQALSQEKPRLGQSGAPLGEAVTLNLAARHVRLSEEQLSSAWSATRQEGAPWIVTLTFPFRGRSRTARWRFDQRLRTITPLNELARDMGWIAPGKRVAAPAPTVRQVNIAEARAKKTSARAKSATKKPARAKPTARRKPTARKKPAARKPAARKPAARAKKAVRRKPATRAKKPASSRSRKPAAAKKRAARKRPTAKTRKPTARRKPATQRKPAVKRKAPARAKPAARRAAAERPTTRRTPARSRRRAR